MLLKEHGASEEDADDAGEQEENGGSGAHQQNNTVGPREEKRVLLRGIVCRPVREVWRPGQPQFFLVVS